MSRESALWDWLKGARLAFGEDLHMDRVENAVLEGMPDVEGHLRSFGQFWLELKSAARPARASTPIRFKVRTKQIEWIDRRWSLGGHVFWLLQVGSAHERRLFLAPGPLGPQLQKGISESDLAVECCNSGIFERRISHTDLLLRVFQCRNRFSPFPA